MAKTLSATVTLKDGMAFDAIATSGHKVVLDSDESVGGTNEGFRPMEMLLVGLGGCTGMDVISILRKMHQEVTGYQVKVQGNRAEEHPKVYTEITVEHVVKGKRLSADSVRRAVELSATRYCPASAMLGKSAHILHKYRIVDVETDTEQVGSLG
jgi:putative redox protein